MTTIHTYIHTYIQKRHQHSRVMVGLAQAHPNYPLSVTYPNYAVLMPWWVEPPEAYSNRLVYLSVCYSAARFSLRPQRIKQ